MQLISRHHTSKRTVLKLFNSVLLLNLVFFPLVSFSDTKELPPSASVEISDKKNQGRPNILFIILDDQSPFDLKFYNPDSELDSPEIDKLAAEGMVIDGAYHMGSGVGGVCAPSRTMIMSGRILWRAPVKGNPYASDPELVPPDLAEYSIPAMFNKAGYATMRTCKTGNSYGRANAHFQVTHDKKCVGADDETGSAWHAQRVLDYLEERERKEDDRPFLIYYGFTHPHDPRFGKEELLRKYGATNDVVKSKPPTLSPERPAPALPANHLTGHPFDNGHLNVRDERAVHGVWSRRDEATIRNELGRVFACVENIDIQIGRVLRKLEAMGELENTIIFYTADHGIAIGRHGLQGKQNLYEHSWRVPFVVKGPGIKPGRAQGNIYLLDVLSTLCDFAGIEAPGSNQGISFRPVIEGKQETVRDVLYGVYCGGSKPGMRAVRKGDWKLIQYDVANGTVQKKQLFNLKKNPLEFIPEHERTDPWETNLAGNPKYAEKQAELEALLLSEMRRHHDPYRFWDQPDDGLPEIVNKKQQKKQQIKADEEK